MLNTSASATTFLAVTNQMNPKSPKSNCFVIKKYKRIEPIGLKLLDQNNKMKADKRRLHANSSRSLKEIEIHKMAIPWFTKKQIIKSKKRFYKRLNKSSRS